ncbi:MAG: DUF4838 domain-containing protein, partial [Armatimonadota bacterium]
MRIPTSLSLLTAIATGLLAGGVAQAADALVIDDCTTVQWQGSPAPRQATYSPPGGAPHAAIGFPVEPGRDAQWSRPAQLDLSESQALALRLASPISATGTVTLASGQGAFVRGFELAAGEQIVILNLGSFQRQGAASGLDAVTEIKLALSAADERTTVRLLAVEAWAKGEPPFGEELVLYLPANRIRHQGVAYPLYALLDGGALTDTSRVLAEYLRRMFDIELPLNPDAVGLTANTTNVILVGKPAALKTEALTEDELTPWGHQGFIIRATGPRVVVAGNTPHGVSYGVYRFLEQQGCRFYARGCEIVPTRPQPTLLDCDLADKPFFHVKGCVGPYSIRGWSYQLLGDPREAEDPELFDDALWLDHTAAYLVPKKLYYDAHPEYYALLGNGERLPKDTPDNRVMLCLTHPDVLRISAERMLGWIDMQQDRLVFVVSQGDGAEWCNCETCLAVGNRADQTLHWANHVARAVAERFPDKILLTNAYNGADLPPVHLKPEKNLVVLYAAWPNASSAPNSLRDFDARENIVARTHLEGWLKVAPHNMGLYDYNGLGRYTLYGMASRVKWCARRDMRAIWYCGINNSFRELFAYVHSRLTWDPWEDVGRLKDDFIRAYYGEAAPAVRELFDLIYNRLEFGDYDGRMRAGGYPPADFYEYAFVDRAFRLFDRALELAQDSRAATADLRQTKELFIGNCFALRPGRSGQLTDDQYRTFGRSLQEYLDFTWMPEYERNLAEAREKGAKPPTFDAMAEKIWGLTYVDIGPSPAEGRLPGLLREMLADPQGTIENHRQTDFVEKIPNGWRLSGLQFEGGQYWRRYGWNCPPRDHLMVVRGTMTRLSRMRARLHLDADPPQRAGVIEIEGQDSDKEWCEPVAIQLIVNGTKIFEGPNGFTKRDWSRRTWPL